MEWKKKKNTFRRHGSDNCRVGGSPWNIPDAALSSHFRSYARLSAADVLIDLSSNRADSLLFLVAANWLHVHQAGSDYVTSISWWFIMFTFYPEPIKMSLQQLDPVAVCVCSCLSESGRWDTTLCMPRISYQRQARVGWRCLHKTSILCWMSGSAVVWLDACVCATFVEHETLWFGCESSSESIFLPA